MSLLKCGFFIPELNDYLLRAGISTQSLAKYYDRYTQFELIDQQQIEYESTDSLICTTYNILSRGYPTWCSLRLAAGLLKKFLPASTVIVSTERDSCRIKFDSPLPEVLSPEERSMYERLLNEWSPSGQSDASVQLGSKALSIFSLLEALRKAAFIQKALLFALFAHSDRKKLTAYVDIEDPELSALLIDDLNELLSAQSILADLPVPVLGNSLIHSEADLILGTSWGKFDNYRQFQKHYLFVDAFPNLQGSSDESHASQRKPQLSLLCGKAITYSELGKPRDSNNESIPEFEFTDEAKERALLFFLNNIFRKSGFRPGQLAIISRALQNKDVIGLLPTGGGKSLCFQLCGLLQPGINLVIDPINSLMKDQYDKLCEYAIQNAGFINTLNKQRTEDEDGSDRPLNDIILDRFINGELLFLFISPERLLIQKFRTALQDCLKQRNLIHYCVIDEAHCVSEWGHDFRIPYLRLADNLRRFCGDGIALPTLFALTATASYDVLSDVQREMGLQADSIISLPPEAIDRKELSFNFVDLSAHDVRPAYPDREFDLKSPKYGSLRGLLQQLPHLITKIGGRSLLLDDALETNFFKPIDGKYPNAGIIFCPTRSIKLPNGVMALYDHIRKQIPELKAGTYFSPTDSETILEVEIDHQAADATKYQEQFLKNDLNVMICTKGFGMGIDKPNLRYTIHYAFPPTIESFYQEAGRAGRDRQRAVCSILYHPADEQTSKDFLDKSFRGVGKEMEILNELLTEVRYQPRYFLDQLEDHLRSTLNVRFRLKFYPETDPTFIFVNGPFVQNRQFEKGYGALRLANLSHKLDSVKNVEMPEAENVINLMRGFLRQHVPSGNYKEWITQQKAPGVRTMLRNHIPDSVGPLYLQVGFSNDMVDELAKTLKLHWKSIDTRVVKAGYSFSNTPTEFLDNLSYRYAVHLENRRKEADKKENAPFYSRPIRDVIAELPSLDQETITTLNKAFYRIRLQNDTQRAVYRMIQVGIIDDYSIDYAKECIMLHFSKREESTYTAQLKNYLQRYLGQESLTRQLEKYKDENLDAFVHPLKILTDFFQEEVKAKRHRSLSTMKEFCEAAIKNGEEEFRQHIILYFTSKYAKPEFLPKDLDEGRSEDVSVFRKYLSYLHAAPDNLGSEKDNARHLLGACTRLRIGIGDRNHTLNLLHAFAWLALADQKMLKTEKVKMATLFLELHAAILYFSAQIGWPQGINLLKQFYNHTVDTNPDIALILINEINKVILIRLVDLTKKANSNLKPLTHGNA